MTTPDELARAWTSERGLKPTPAALAMASRRIRAWGRLAVTPLVHLPPPARVRVLEHGRHHVDAGVVIAEVWVNAADDEQTQRMAAEVHRVVRDSCWSADLLLAVAVHRATWLDRALGWVQRA